MALVFSMLPGKSLRPARGTEGLEEGAGAAAHWEVFLVGAFSVLKAGTRSQTGSRTGAAAGGRVQPLSRFAWLLLRLGKAGEGRAVGVLTVWSWWERLTTWWQHVRPVQAGGVLRFNLTRYRGPDVVLRDGSVVHAGDRIVELHLDNRALLARAAEARANPWSLVRAVDGDLEALRGRIAAGRLGEVRALHGVSLFARAGARLGFEVRPLPTTWQWTLVRFFFVGLVALYHHQGWKAASVAAGRWPGEVWMSRAALERRSGRR